MERIKLFIASSSEGLGAARAVRSGLSKELRDEAEVRLWTRKFDYSQTYIESLETAAAESDFAVAVMTADDITRSRGKEAPVPRDNVVFELGLFMGSLGRERCVIVSESQAGLDLPSDLLGVHGASFARPDDGNLEATLDPVCVDIADRVRKARNRRKLSIDDHRMQDEITDFVRRIEGWWWERIDSEDSSRISFFRMAPAPFFNAVELAGRTYDERGVRLAKWSSTMARVDVDRRSVLYHWQGERVRQEEGHTDYHGFAEFELNAASKADAPLSRGEGKFWNVDEAHPGRTTLQAILLRRETTPEVIATMSEGTGKGIADAVAAALKPW